MTQAELFRWLLESTCASSAAIILVLLLRRPLRAFFGANAAYLLWLLLPLAVLAASLPARVVPVTVPETMADAGMGTVAVVASMDAAGTTASWLLLAWLAGVAGSALWQGAVQRRFRRSLGAMRIGDDGHVRAEATAGLPAVVGLRARIVLPADFEARYDDGERALILAHERVHLARRDVLGNALLAALRCAYWFNPLAWIAADRFRRDQELACDETVIARHPRARRAYGEAMVKTQLSAMPAPLACHWFGGHPLKERIAMLKRPVPGPRRVLAGLAIASTFVAGSACAVWAARPATTVVAGADAAAPVSGPRSIDLSAHGKPLRAVAVEAAQQAGVRADGGAQVDVQSKMLAPPRYPADAVSARVTGRVVLIVDVAADGSVSGARVEKSEPAGVFDQATLDAVKNWTFKPAMKDGEPVAGRVRVPVEFAMDGPPGAPAEGEG